MHGREQTQDTLRALRRARRRHYIREGDWVDSLYRAYVVGILATLALFYGTFALGGSTDATAARDVREHGVVLLGLGVAVLVAMGLRSGARGGPLAPEAPDVAFLLLSPVGRGEVLRSVAFRQLRGVILLPGLAGAVAGNVAASRLGGPRAEWLVAGALFGLLTSLAMWGAALVASGAGLPTRRANLVGGVLVVWSVLDVLTTHATSPTAQLARVGVWPLTSSLLAVVGVVAALALVVVGLARVGRSSLEPLRHRARLVGELRYAATLQDMRSVIVLHRELAQELPRTRPWWRSDARRGGAVWQRDWRGLARWPLSRVVRTLVLAAVVGLVGVGLWHGTYALVLLGGVALFLVGIDTVEGLAQETDHPEAPQQVPVPWGELVLAHLTAPGVALLVLVAAAALVAGGITASATALALGGITVVPAALAAVVGAGVSVVMGAPPPTLYLDLGFPELTMLWLVLRQVLAPLLVVSAFVPFALGHEAAADGRSAVGAALVAALLPLALVIGASLWLRSRWAVTR